eukprot:766677-Hanusia_phi.AAC.8
MKGEKQKEGGRLRETEGGREIERKSGREQGGSRARGARMAEQWTDEATYHGPRFDRATRSSCPSEFRHGGSREEVVDGVDKGWNEKGNVGAGAVENETNAETLGVDERKRGGNGGRDCGRAEGEGQEEQGEQEQEQEKDGQEDASEEATLARSAAVRRVKRTGRGDEGMNAGGRTSYKEKNEVRLGRRRKRRMEECCWTDRIEQLVAEKITPLPNTQRASSERVMGRRESSRQGRVRHCCSRQRGEERRGEERRGEERRGEERRGEERRGEERRGVEWRGEERRRG